MDTARLGSATAGQFGCIQPSTGANVISSQLLACVCHIGIREGTLPSMNASNIWRPLRSKLARGRSTQARGFIEPEHTSSCFTKLRSRRSRRFKSDRRTKNHAHSSRWEAGCKATAKHSGGFSAERLDCTTARRNVRSCVASVCQ